MIGFASTVAHLPNLFPRLASEFGTVMANYWPYIAAAVGAIVALAISVRALERFTIERFDTSLLMSDDEYDQWKRDGELEALFDRLGIDAGDVEDYREYRRLETLEAQYSKIAEWSMYGPDGAPDDRDEWEVGLFDSYGIDADVEADYKEHQALARRDSEIRRAADWSQFMDGRDDDADAHDEWAADRDALGDGGNF